MTAWTRRALVALAALGLLAIGGVGGYLVGDDDDGATGASAATTEQTTGREPIITTPVEDPDDAPAASEDEDDEPSQQFLAVGEAGVDDDVTFKITSLSTVDSIPGGELSEGPLTPNDGAELVRADLTYKNNTQIPLDLLCGGAPGFVLLDDADRNYSADDSVQLEGNEEVCLDEVAPGFKADVVLAFQVPAGTTIGGLVAWNTESEDDSSGDISQLVFIP